MVLSNLVAMYRAVVAGQALALRNDDVRAGSGTRRWLRRIVGITAAVGLAVGVYAWFGMAGRNVARSAPSSVAPPVPVTAGAVAVEDFPIYRVGVGTADALQIDPRMQPAPGNREQGSPQ